MFLQTTAESASLNQYWYSSRTIEALVSEIESGALGHRIAFLSTPSVYCSLPAQSRARQASIVFDIDEQWAGPNFRRFDFHQGVDADSFTAAIVDPPFVTRDVWLKYCQAIKKLLAPGGRLVLTTIPENRDMLVAELGPLHHATFMPAMHRTALPYQYAIFHNYDLAHDSPLARRNPEVPDDVLQFAQTTQQEDPGRPLTGTHLSFDQLLARELERDQAAPRA